MATLKDNIPITTKEIAKHLNVSQRTADTYRKQTREALKKQPYDKITLQQIRKFKKLD